MIGPPKRPVLRYHGGKWLLAPWIISHFAEHRVYCEPFGGAASVLLRKPRAQSEIYNDLDDVVVNVFQVLRDPEKAKLLHNQLLLTPFARSEFEHAYDAPADSDVENARRTIVRAFMGFGSASFNSAHATGFRVYVGTNRQRRPHQDWVSYPNQIDAFVERLRCVIIENRPAAQVIARHDKPDTLFYVDPPYPLITRGSASGVRQKYRHEMTEWDHAQLATALQNAKGMVVLSGYACELYDRDLYAGWKRFEKPCMSDGARPRIEVLWLNPAASLALNKPVEAVA